MPRFTFRRVYKRWLGLPLPIVSHIERYDDGELEARIHHDRQGTRIESIKTVPLIGQPGSQLLDDLTTHGVYRFLVRTYAVRKLQELHTKAEVGEQPYITSLLPKEEAELIADTSPVVVQKRGHRRLEWLGDNKPFAELMVELYKNGWISDPHASMETLRRLSGYQNIDLPMRPLKDKTGKPTYRSLYTGYSPNFHLILKNKKKHK